MNWRFTLVGDSASQAQEQPFVSEKERQIRLVQEKGGKYILTQGLDPDQDPRRCIAIFDVNEGTITCEVSVEHVELKPNPVTTGNTSFVVPWPALVSGRASLALLRSGDEINFLSHGVTVHFELDHPRIEVGSSAPTHANGHPILGADSVPATVPHEEDSAEEDNEEIDEDDLDATTMDIPAYDQQPTTLPAHSPESQSRVFSTARTARSMQAVAETPVANRVKPASFMDDAKLESRDTTPVPANEDQLPREPQTTGIFDDPEEEDDDDEDDGQVVQVASPIKETAPPPTNGQTTPNEPEDNEELPPAFNKKSSAKHQYGKKRKRGSSVDQHIADEDENSEPMPKKKPKLDKHVKTNNSSTPVRSMRGSSRVKGGSATKTPSTASFKDRAEDPSPVETARPSRKATKKESITPEPSRKTTVKKGSTTSEPSKSAKKAVKKASVTLENTTSAAKAIKKGSINLVFSGSTIDSQDDMRLLKRLGVTIKKDFKPGSDYYICTSAIKSTVKILSAMVLGIPIISENWVAACRDQGDFVDPNDYQLVKVDTSRAQLFSDKTVMFTPAVINHYGKDGTNGIERILIDANAQDVITERVTSDMEFDGQSTIFIGMREKDPVASALVGKDVVVYDKELIPRSVIAAELKLDDDDLKLTVHGKAAKKGRRARG
ncbi:Hypothetical protein D9617_2g056780 [Elsinoe fawcettii]|nr:Hypothetical protein D9617_2g056780 [Elsinoe fawcettii]